MKKIKQCPYLRLLVIVSALDQLHFDRAPLPIELCSPRSRCFRDKTDRFDRTSEEDQSCAKRHRAGTENLSLRCDTKYTKHTDTQKVGWRSGSTKIPARKRAPARVTCRRISLWGISCFLGLVTTSNLSAGYHCRAGAYSVFHIREGAR